MPAAKPRPPRSVLLRPHKRLTDLAADYGVTYGTLHRWRRKAGASCSTSGQNHWNSKLTREDVDLIRQLSAAGVMQKDIAEKFELAQSTISQVINYRVWP